MKQQNFLFVDIVSSIFLLILFIANFLGLLYILENIFFAALASAFLIVCYYFLIQLLAKNKEVMFKNNFMHTSSILWVFYILLFAISFVLMSHFINIEFNAKKDIQENALKKLNVVDSISTVYKNKSHQVLEDFDAELKTKLTAYKTTGSNEIRNSLTTKPYNIEPTVLNDRTYLNVNQVANAKMTPILKDVEKNIKHFDTEIKNTNNKYKGVFNNWNRLNLVDKYVKLNDYVDNTIDSINVRVEKLPIENDPIIVNYSKDNLPLNNPIEFNKKFKPNYTIPIIALLLIHAFILIPFFSEKVRAYASKSGGNTGQNKDNGHTIEL